MGIRDLDRLLGLMLSASAGKNVTFDRRSFQKFAVHHGKRFSRDEISNGLQTYRTAAARQYTVTAMGYGPASRWRLIGVVGSPSIPRSKATKEQHQWLAWDAVKRERNDLLYEWLSAAKANGVGRASRQARIERFEEKCYGELGMVRFPAIHQAVQELVQPLYNAV